jgi:hypothetical protein
MLVINLHGGLVWRSSVGLLGRVVTISFLDLGIGSMVLDGLEAPNWFFSRNKANKDGNSK